nr:hypothetical protein [Tanacetum cinerariifolium]
MQQPMQNLKDISDPITTIDMALVLMAKAFTLNGTTLTNNNQRSSLNPKKMQIAQPGMNIDQDRQMLMVEDNNRLSVDPGIANQYGIGNVITARAEGNGNGINRNQISYEKFDFMAAACAYDEIEKVTVNCTLKDNLQQASTSVIPNVGESNALSKPVTSNLALSSRESTVVNNESVIAPGIFRINPFKASRVYNFMPNKHVKASVRIKPINVSQPYVITKKDVNSNTNGFSPKDVDSTTRTRRTQPRNNPKNDKVPSKSKSGCLLNILDKIKENHRNLQSSTNKKHTSSACNNIKLGVQNEKSKTKNHSANVSKSANQKKHKANVKKSKKLGYKDRLASSRPSKPRTCLNWLPTGRIFYLSGTMTKSSNIESEFDTFVFDTASTFNPQETISKGFLNSTSFIDRFLKLQRQNSSIYLLAVL